MPSVTHDDAPPLADLMPWSVAPPRLGRGWPAGPDPATLKARWDAFVKAEGPDREALLEPTRSRTLHSAVGRSPAVPPVRRSWSAPRAPARSRCASCTPPSTSSG